MHQGRKSKVKLTDRNDVLERGGVEVFFEVWQRDVYRFELRS